MNQETKVFSLSDLDASKASDEAFEFECINANGEGIGIFISVLGSQSERVTSEVARLVNARRRKQAAREVSKKIGVGAKQDIDTMEDDVDFGRQMAAVRIVAWRGITEPCTPENAYKLCCSNRSIADQVTTHSEELGNFMKL